MSLKNRFMLWDLWCNMYYVINIRCQLSNALVETYVFLYVSGNPVPLHNFNVVEVNSSHPRWLEMKSWFSIYTYPEQINESVLRTLGANTLYESINWNKWHKPWSCYHLNLELKVHLFMFSWTVIIVVYDGGWRLYMIVTNHWRSLQ